MCPIDFDVFTDPVIADDGRTYERTAIQRWFDAGNRISPMTRQRISTTLIPNRAIRDEVERIRGTMATGAAVAAVAVPVDAPLSITASYDDVRKLLHVQFAADKQMSDGSDMIILLDTSGSMDSPIASAGKEAQHVTRLDIAKHSVRVLAALCKDTDRICLIVFNDYAATILPMTAMDATGKARVDTLLDGVMSRGSTNLWDAILVATTVANGITGRRVSAILLTDGEPTTGTPPRGIVETLPLALKLKEPWVLHTLGFSDSVDSKLLCDIAEWGKGTFGFIPSGDMVGTVCINTAAHCLSVAHRGTQFTAGSSGSTQTGPILVQQPRDFVFMCGAMPATILCGGEVVPVVKRSLEEFQVARSHLLRILDIVLASKHAHLMEGALHNFVKGYTESTDPRVKLMLRDIASANSSEGQVLLAAKFLGSWGYHYLRCYRSAQKQQHCVNFKDVGLQDYGGPLFKTIVAEGDLTFANMKPMKPRATVATGATVATVAAPVAAPIDYSHFHNASGGCIAGECRVRMGPDDARIPIADLRRGDTVWTPDGPAVVLHAIEINTRARSQPMTQIGHLCITPWHPVVDPEKNGRVWTFPAHINGLSDRLVQTVYNLVLTRGHIIDVEGIQCVTLNHRFVEEPVAHAFFGTQAVVDCLQKQPGFHEGRPVYTNLVADKNEAGVICGWREG
jgi:Mg-chelatase subunit ChlD